MVKMAKNKVSGYWRWLWNQLGKIRNLKKWYQSTKETLTGFGILLALLGSIVVPSMIFAFALYFVNFPLLLGAVIICTSTVLTASYIRYHFEKNTS
jgi:hypothetical protein